MKNALIGYTGFIGSNLLNFKKNLSKFNSKNIHKIKNKNFNIIVCAGTSSKIWLAKKKPAEDKKKINNLLNNLKFVNAKKFILISTSEIYGKHRVCNENSKLDMKKISNYGLNRLKFENFIIKKFKDNHIIRLPIVYGKKFSKNFIFDLINSNNIEILNGNDFVQIYNVTNLKNDINFVIKNNIRKINISSKPIKVSKIAKKFFKINLNKKKSYRTINMKSKYGKHKGYYMSLSKCYGDLRKFLSH